MEQPISKNIRPLSTSPLSNTIKNEESSISAIRSERKTKLHTQALAEDKKSKLVPLKKLYHLVTEHIELVALLLSTLAFASLLSVLGHFNNRQKPDWSHFSLNSLISWISNVAKLGIIILIGSGINQLKWVWFTTGEKQLSHLQAFDDAKDPFGAAQLLLTIGIR
jgi:hypothetical protein